MESENQKILVVDDEPELREILVFDFENLGYVVKEAENAFSALEQLDKNPDIKVIVSDIKMPDGDGVTLLKNIQSRKIKDNVSLIFVTGFSDLKIEEAFNLGADGYMTKPFDRRVLSALVKRLLISESHRWTTPNSVPKSDGKKIKLNLPSLECATREHSLSIGRGGMFVATNSFFPVGSTLDFEIDFSQESPKKIQGQGIVRWARHSSTADLPAGLGIEFLYLNDEFRDFILNSETRRQQVAFIPIC